MIPLLLAALVAQAADATYSTADDARARGVKLSLKYPSMWESKPLDTPGGVRQLRSPDGKSWVLISVGYEEAVAAAEKQVGAGKPTARELLDSGRLDRPIVAVDDILDTRTTDEFGAPFRIVDYMSPQVAVEEAVFTVDGPRAVVLIFHLPARDRSRTMSSLLRVMVQSIRFEGSPGDSPSSTSSPATSSSSIMSSLSDWFFYLALIVGVAVPAGFVIRIYRNRPNQFHAPTRR